jgi:hypothetical protein
MSRIHLARLVLVAFSAGLASGCDDPPFRPLPPNALCESKPRVTLQEREGRVEVRIETPWGTELDDHELNCTICITEPNEAPRPVFGIEGGTLAALRGTPGSSFPVSWALDGRAARTIRARLWYDVREPGQGSAGFPVSWYVDSEPLELRADAAPDASAESSDG